MRRILLAVLAIGFATIIKAQELPVNEQTGKITFMEVVETGNVTAKEGYDVIKKWCDGKGMTVTEDAAGAKYFLTKKHKVSYPATKGGITHDGVVTFNVQFFFKDGKFRYILTDFVHSGKYGSGGKMENEKPQDGYGKISERAWNMIRDQTYDKTTKMVTSFKKALQEFQNDPARSDDW